jgi:hypothetical protein
MVKQKISAKQRQMMMRKITKFPEYWKLFNWKLFYIKYELSFQRTCSKQSFHIHDCRVFLLWKCRIGQGTNKFCRLLVKLDLGKRNRKEISSNAKLYIMRHIILGIVFVWMGGNITNTSVWTHFWDLLQLTSTPTALILIHELCPHQIVAKMETEIYLIFTISYTKNGRVMVIGQEN